MGMEMGMGSSYGRIILACMSGKRIREVGELIWDRLGIDEHERSKKVRGGPHAQELMKETDWMGIIKWVFIGNGYEEVVRLTSVKEE